MNKLVAFVKDESAATAIEYGLIAGIMAVCLIAAMPKIKTALTGRLSAISTNITNAS